MADGVQSLERGMAILRLLASRPAMSATAIAEALGIHTSSASRLLQSLLKEGFVCKPDFHSFALDFGALVFAGRALACFPVVAAAATVCNRLQRRAPGFNVTAGVLWDHRILYLTRANRDLSQRLIDDAEFPPHRSSLGLLFAASLADDEALALLNDSLRRFPEPRRDDVPPGPTAEELLRRARALVRRHGFFFMRDMGGNRVNAAMAFDAGGPPAALAIFGGGANADETALLPGRFRELLAEGAGEIQRLVAGG